ncbi:MAG: DUF5615 family PIN-like protein [Chloroflexi bacterium]|nr:DUF5615 family PIN-like protein [Chloroflexota bacterium]
MLLLVDECVPVDVGRVLAGRGHDVRFVREYFGSGTKDPVISIGGDFMGAVVVTLDKDFRSLVKRVARGERQSFRKLGRISLRCSPVRATQRVKALAEWIEFAYLQAQKSSDKRMIIQITETNFTAVC